jgi:GntR family transcriptional regulator
MASTSPPRRTKDLVRRVRDLLRAEIVAGGIPDGALPSEEALRAEFAASRACIREALDALAAEGLLQRVRGQGTFVTAAPTWTSLREAHGVEPPSQDSIWDGRMVSQIVDWDDVPAAPPIAKRLRIAPGEQVLRIDYVAYLGALPMAVVTNYVRYPDAAPLRPEHLRVDFYRMLQAGNIAIGESTFLIDCALSDGHDAVLLGLAPGSPLTLLEQVIYGPDGQPVDVAFARTCASRTTLFSRARRSPSPSWQNPGRRDLSRQNTGRPNPSAQNPSAQNPNSQNPNSQKPNGQNPNGQNPSRQRPAQAGRHPALSVASPWPSGQISAPCWRNGGVTARTVGRHPGHGTMPAMTTAVPMARRDRRGQPARWLRDMLRSEVIDGCFPGGLLPSEAELMKTFLASRSVVREALDLLRGEGLIERIQGTGTLAVAQRVAAKLVGIHGVADRGEEPLPGLTNRVLAREIIPMPRIVARHLDAEPGTPCLLYDYIGYLFGQTIGVFTNYLRFPEADAVLAAPFDRDWYTMLDAAGLSLGESDLLIEVMRADAGVAELLGIPEGRPLLGMQQVIRDAGGAPYDFAILRSRGDQMSIWSREVSPHFSARRGDAS